MTEIIERFLSFNLIKDGGNFTGASGNVLQIAGARASVDIVKAGGLSWGTANITIYGLSLSQVNDLSTLGQAVIIDHKNKVQVYAGDSTGQRALAYDGIIFQAWGDFSNQPNCSIKMMAQTGLDVQVAPADSYSAPGTVDVVTVLQSLCNTANYALDNHGVSGVSITDPYFSGTVLMQIQDCIEAAGINAHLDNNILAIWPRGGTRDSAFVPTFGPGTGLVGYPVFTANGLEMDVVYDPTVTFGAKVMVNSSLRGTSGTWQVAGLTHNLSCLVPGGPWFTRLRLVPPGFYTQAF